MPNSKKIEIGFYSQPAPGTNTKIDSNHYTVYAWLEGSTRVENVNLKTDRNEARGNNNKIKFEDLPGNISENDGKFFIHIWISDKKDKDIRSDVKIFEISNDLYDSADLNIKKDVINIWIESADFKPLATKIIIGGESPEPPSDK